jgi:hypothetical protein
LEILLRTTTLSYSQPAIPKFEPFQPVNTITSPQIQPTYPIQSNPLLPRDPYQQQNLRILQQSPIMSVPGKPSYDNQVYKEIMSEIKEEEIQKAGPIKWTQAYQRNFQQFLKLNPDSFSITRAVYLTESAWYDKPFSYQEFEESIKQGADLVKQILKREYLSESNNIAVNYAIQKLYTQSNIYYDTLSRRSFTVEKLRYDFNDFMGDKDWSKMFVTKLLQTGTGQCNSLPKFYLCIAQELHAKTYLSLSPNHSFIQYFDDKGHRYNFETTNGNLVTPNWLMQSTYVNATALKNQTYLDTLSNRKLYAQFLGDMLLGYSTKVNYYDDLANTITAKILSIDSTNLIALMTLANVHGANFRKLWKAENYPQEKEFNKYPQLNAEYQIVKSYEQKIEQLGFQEMPADDYQKWLKSVELAKQREQMKQEQERMQKEIQRLKKLKYTFINKPKQ